MGRYRRDQDILHQACELLMSLDPNVDVQVVDRVLYHMRIEYGGQRLRVQKQPEEMSALAERLGVVLPPGFSRRR